MAPTCPNTQSTLTVCWHIIWSTRHSSNCRAQSIHPAHKHTHTHLSTIPALISSLAKLHVDHQRSPRHLHDNKINYHSTMLNQHTFPRSTHTQGMQMKMQISGFKVPAGLICVYRSRAGPDCGAALPLSGPCRSCTAWHREVGQAGRGGCAR